MNDTNESWLQSLSDTGIERDRALAQLREILLRRLRRAFQGERPVDDALLEDMTQEALIKTLDNLDQFQGRSRFTTWSTMIAIRSVYSELRRRHWKDISLDDTLQNATSGLEQAIGTVGNLSETLVHRAMVEQMHRIIDQELTEKQRTALLAELAGMPLAEIGRQTGGSRNSVYKLTHDARKRLRRGLESAGYGASDLQTVVGQS